MDKPSLAPGYWLILKNKRQDNKHTTWFHHVNVKKNPTDYCYYYCFFIMCDAVQWTVGFLSLHAGQSVCEAQLLQSCPPSTPQGHLTNRVNPFVPLSLLSCVPSLPLYVSLSVFLCPYVLLEMSVSLSISPCFPLASRLSFSLLSLFLLFFVSLFLYQSPYLTSLKCHYREKKQGSIWFFLNMCNCYGLSSCTDKMFRFYSRSL